MKIVTDELTAEEVDYFSGWVSMQMMFMLDIAGDKESFAHDFLRSLRPEIVKALVRDRDDLFNARYRPYIKEAKDA